jgi:PAS domain S-box-containing protein
MFDRIKQWLGRGPPSGAVGSESATQFDSLVAGVRDYAIFLLDAHGNVRSWNSGAERIKGYRADEIIGRHFSIFYPKEALDSNFPAHELDVAGKVGRFEDEGWRIRKDGSRFWANVVITALRNESGQVHGFLKITRDLTERREAEERARQLAREEAARHAAESSAREAITAQREERRQREQLHVTLSSIGDAVIVTDASGVVSFLNPVAADLCGWSAADAAGQPLETVFRIVNEYTRQTVENPVDRVLSHGFTVGLANHTVLLARDGREIPISDSAAPIRGEGGAITGVVLVFRDVTEARRAMQARLRLAAIVESSDDAIISHDLEGQITSWNKGAENLYGYTATEVLGRPLSLLTSPDRPDEVQSLLERLKRGERIDHFETVRIHKNGARIDVSLTISPVRNSEGAIVGASKIARDITQAKRNEAALRFLADASKALSELTDVASTLQRVAGLAVPHFADWCTVDMLDPDGALSRVAVAHIDPAKVKLAQELQKRFPADPASPRGLWNILRTGQPEMVPEITEELIRQSTPNPEIRAILHELGLRSYIGVPLVLRGKTIGVITFIAAESGRQYTPTELNLAEDLVNRAAVAIENSKLYSDLKDADRRKDEFLAMLAHELRNPLAPIRNALHIMNSPGVAPDMVKRAHEMTERQVQHMVRLIDDLLDVSRIMRGRIELRREAIELSTMIARAVETVHPILDAQGQELVVTTPPDPIWLDADPTRLVQIIGNLLNNAAKFSERSGRIWLTVERDDGEAVLRVRDEGAGIPADLLPHVFDLFVQGDRTLERTRGGLGIGLTVVRKLVELHGGTISVQSDGAGKGSELTVRLPITRAAEQGAPGSSLSGSPLAVGQHCRVLVVDDNVDAAESVAILLRLWSHDVDVAFNGSDALALIVKQKPELVILDIGLPGMSGYELARRIRSDRRFDDTTLVAVTGYGQENDRLRSQDAGFDHHLTKPIHPSQLHDILAAPARSGV